MEHKIINTGDYLIVVNDSEIKEDDYYLFTWGGEQDIQRFKDQESDRENHKYLYRTSCKKIIAHLPINSPILKSVDILPTLKNYNKPDPKLIDSMAMRYRHDFGSLDKKQQDSIRITMTQLWEEVVGEGFYKVKEKSLQQPKIVGFKCEMVNFEVDMGLGTECIEYSQYPKTIINSENLIQWIGEYIYD